jgi:hypothetical protein
MAAPRTKRSTALERNEPRGVSRAVEAGDLLPDEVERLADAYACVASARQRRRRAQAELDAVAAGVEDAIDPERVVASSSSSMTTSDPR